MQPNDSKYALKMARLKGKAQRESGPPRSMPSILTIARYWSERHTFRHFDWYTPGCFACGGFGRANEMAETLEVEWSRSGLERCHLVAHAEGGSVRASNLVLLCKRCHRAAPMVGISPQPMIDWINRRQNWLDWLTQRLKEEFDALNPTLPQEFSALGFSSEETQARLTAMAKVLRLGYHADGDVIATLVCCANAVVQYELDVRLALKAQAR